MGCTYPYHCGLLHCLVTACVLLLFLGRLPLESLKNKIKRNLKLLESEGLVSAESDYQELINAIAKVRSLVWFRANMKYNRCACCMLICVHR